MLSLTGHLLTLEDVARVSRDRLLVALAPEAVQAMIASRQVVDKILAAGETVYGINTGFGAMSSVSIAAQDVDMLQQNLVRSHAVGTGEKLDTATVRAMLLLRANTLVQGCSGVRPVVVETLLTMLNAGVHPVIPSQGSLGASGDLAPLAHLALVLMGEGEAEVRGMRMQGEEALKKAGISPLSLKAKEGLALLNGTQMMTALGVLTLLDAEKLLTLADLAGAMTVEAVQGSHKPFSDRVARVRPHPGHARSSTVSRALLSGSEIEHAHEHCAKVQDPYSLRCIPQVHGAVYDALAYVRRVLEVEINAVTDNPLVFADGTVISQGNFHGEPVAMALDLLAIALAELGSISERRMDKLMNPVFSELPAFLVKDAPEGLNSGFMIAHYTAASLVSENKILAHPACVDSIPTSNDKEDHVSMGALAARKAARVLEHTRWVLAAELLAAAQGLEFRDQFKPGQGVQAAAKIIRGHVPVLTQDRSLAAEVETVVGLIQNGEIHQAIAPFLP